MNYEFNKTEKGFLAELRGAARKAAGAVSQGTLREALAGCAEAGYQRLMADPASQDSGTALSLAGAEVVASWSPSLGLALESGLRPLSRALGHQEEQGEHWPAGDCLVALARSEGGAQQFTNSLHTRAEAEEGGATYRLQGRKIGVVHGAEADRVAIVGQVGEEAALFLVDGRDQGLAWGAQAAVPGFPEAVLADLEVADCVVPADRVVSRQPAEQLLATLVTGENCALLGLSLGLMKRSLQAARQQAKKHEWSGKPLVARQEVSFPLTEMLTLYQTSQLLAYRSAWSLDQGGHDASVLVKTAKVFCTEAAERVTSLALQVQSLTGATMPAEGHRDFLAAKYLQLQGTPNELARSHLGDDAVERWG